MAENNTAYDTIKKKMYISRTYYHHQNISVGKFYYLRIIKYAKIEKIRRLS